VPVAARVGVRTGPVVLPGGDEAGEARYNALGDTVNTAARVQALAGEGASRPDPRRHARSRIGSRSRRSRESRRVAAPSVRGRRARHRQVATRVRGERVSGLLTFLTAHAVSYAESVPYRRSGICSAPGSGSGRAIPRPAYGSS
jgi:hypothetical protein